MTIDRRAFNRYLATGLLGGGGIGFIAGRYSGKENWNSAPLPAESALRGAAANAVGIHQIGLAIAALNDFSSESAGRSLLARLRLEQGSKIHSSEVFAALDKIIKDDFARHETVQVDHYVLSKSEALFILYALTVQGLDQVAYSAPQPETKEGVISAQARFGPDFTVVGQIFNEQADGHGGIWVLAQNTPPGTVIAVNGNPINTRWGAQSLVGAVYGEELRDLISRPAQHEVSLVVPATGIRQVIGKLAVRPRPPAARLEDGRPSTVFCEIGNWATRMTGGKEVVRINTLCGPRSASVYIGDTALTTRIYPRRIEAILDRSVLSAGEQPVRLIDTLSGEAVALGSFEVN